MLLPNSQQSEFISAAPLRFQGFQCAPHAHHGCTRAPGHGCTLTLQAREAMKCLSVSYLLHCRVSHLTINCKVRDYLPFCFSWWAVGALPSTHLKSLLIRIHKVFHYKVERTLYTWNCVKIILIFEFNLPLIYPTFILYAYLLSYLSFYCNRKQRKARPAEKSLLFSIME